MGHSQPVRQPRLVAEGGHTGPQIVRIDRELGQLPVEYLAADVPDKTPAVERRWALCPWSPRSANILVNPVHRLNPEQCRKPLPVVHLVGEPAVQDVIVNAGTADLEGIDRNLRELEGEWRVHLRLREVVR